MVKQSLSEKLAYSWLKKQGHKNIFYRPNSIPDFQTNKGNYEVKRGYKMSGGKIKILFNKKQRDKLKKLKASVLVFLDDPEPIEIIKPDELYNNLVGNIVLYDSGTKSDTYYLRCHIPLELSKKMDIIIQQNEFPNISSLVTKAIKDLLKQLETKILA